MILENEESNNASPNSFKLAPLRRGYTQHNLTDETSGAGAGMDSPMIKGATHNGAAAVVRPSTTIGYVKRNTDGDDDGVRASHWRNIRIDVLGPYDSPKTNKNRKHTVSSATAQGSHQPLFTTASKTSHRRDSVQNTTRHGHASNTYSNLNRSSHHAASPRTPAGAVAAAVAADHDSNTFLPPTASQSQSNSPAPSSSSSSSTKHHHNGFGHGGAHAVSSTTNTQQGAAANTPHLFPKPPMSASSGSSSSSLQHSHHHYSAIFSGKPHGGAGAGNK